MNFMVARPVRGPVDGVGVGVDPFPTPKGAPRRVTNRISADLFLALSLLLSGCTHTGALNAGCASEAEVTVANVLLFAGGVLLPYGVGVVVPVVDRSCPSRPEDRPPQPPIEVDDRSTPVWEQKR